MNFHTLKKTETGRKSASYLYEVMDQDGKVISTRESNRDYVACTSNGAYYFGRLDLIAKGDHGKELRNYSQGYVERGRGYRKTRYVLPQNEEQRQENLDRLKSIAVLEDLPPFDLRCVKSILEGYRVYPVNIK